jgi:mannitol 2-dehydrogenase
VRDTLARLCAESSDRIPKWLLPVVRENLANDGDIHRSAAIVASWARYDEGVDEAGEPIAVVDRLKEPLMAAAARNREDRLAFISNRELFGDLVDSPRFVEAYAAALDALHTKGARATVESLLG